MALEPSQRPGPARGADQERKFHAGGDAEIADATNAMDIGEPDHPPRVGGGR